MRPAMSRIPRAASRAASCLTPQCFRCRDRLSQVLDPIVEDSQLNVYAGELEVRPPAAPTIGPDGAVLSPIDPGDF
jgi:hypothetical protein